MNAPTVKGGVKSADISLVPGTGPAERPCAAPMTATAGL